MDPHFNLFQAYHGGNKHDSERINRLEDNLTRAFLITLKYLPLQTLKEFLLDLGFKDVPQSLCFDLQNLSDKQTLGRIQKSSQKFVLLISRYRADPSQLIINPSDVLKRVLDVASSEEDKELEKKLKSIRNPKGENAFLGERLSCLEQKEAYALLHNARPDGWIYEPSQQSPHGILVESKVGENKQSAPQIFRHITDKRYGLGVAYDAVEEFYKKNVISVSWEDVVKYIPAGTGVSEEIIKQFKEYIIMSGEVINFVGLNEEYDEGIAKGQYQLFLEKLDQFLSTKNTGIRRETRPLDGLWTRYRLSDDKGSVFFTVAMDKQNGISCSLTVSGKKTKKINQVLESDSLKDFCDTLIRDKDTATLLRHTLKVAMHRQDNQKQKGGYYYDTLSFAVNFGEYALANPSFRLEEVLTIAKDVGKHSKQLDFSKKFGWTDSFSGKCALCENTDFFKIPQKIIEQFGDFMMKLKPLLEDA